METIRMSLKERRRLELLSRVRDGKLTLVKASELMGLSYRQAKRVWARYREQGDAGLVHRLRGRPSNRRRDESKREAVLNAYREKYSDFGPTLAAEYLACEEGLEVSTESLRQWLLAAGLWTRRRKRNKHRRWRARKEYRGELVQFDGSHHDWFEGRRSKAVLMVTVDDATNETYARFFEGETTSAAFETLRQYVGQYGLPRAVYVDRHSIHHTTRDATADEALADEPPLTQFGRAMQELDVKLILAHSPQAKGRVERRNGVLQDRLVKAMRLRGINDLGPANRFLEKEFLPAFNDRFRVESQEPADLHRRVNRHVDLDQILAYQEARVVRNDGTLRWRNRWLQLTGKRRPRAGSRVKVCEQLDGRLRLFWGKRELFWEELPGRPEPKRGHRPRRQAAQSQPHKPSAEHPWRRPFLSNSGGTESATVVGGGSVPAR